MLKHDCQPHKSSTRFTSPLARRYFQTAPTRGSWINEISVARDFLNSKILVSLACYRVDPRGTPARIPDIVVVCRDEVSGRWERKNGDEDDFFTHVWRVKENFSRVRAGLDTYSSAIYSFFHGSLLRIWVACIFFFFHVKRVTRIRFIVRKVCDTVRLKIEQLQIGSFSFRCIMKWSFVPRPVIFV